MLSKLADASALDVVAVGDIMDVEYAAAVAVTVEKRAAEAIVDRDIFSAIPYHAGGKPLHEP